jgi:Glycosyl transferase family 2
MDSRPGIRVSVALCTYNGERFIREQLRSIFEQTVTPFEVVVSDDNSADTTVDIVEATWRDLTAEYPDRPIALRLVENPAPLGVTANFEQAIRETSGDAILLSDQDDVWRDDRVEKLTQLLARRPDVLMVHSDARVVDESGAPLGYTLFEALEVSEDDLDTINNSRALDILLRRNIVTGATVALRRELAVMAVPFPKEWVHDEWLAIVAAALDGSIAVTAEPLIDYRQHGRNEIGVKEPTLIAKAARVLTPRGERNRDIARRTRVFQARMAGLATAVTPETLEKIAGKLAHDEVRAALRDNRMLRIIPVLREALTGRYSLFSSQGAADIVRDLLQPAAARSQGNAR